MTGNQGLPTLADLVERRERFDITCHTHDCRRHVVWEAEEAVRLLGERTTFAAAARRLRCSVCGARGRDRAVSCRGYIVDHYWRMEVARALQNGKEPPERPAWPPPIPPWPQAR